MSACANHSPQPNPVTTQEPLSWADVQALPAPPAGQRIAYGADPEQYGVLRLPIQDHKAPVIVLIHGGCWLQQFDLSYFEHWADWLNQLGYATWNIEYRRIGHATGGWPGTFEDVQAALSALPNLPNTDRLDLSKVVLMGHSAGGHLALWLAAKNAESVGLQAVVGLAPITDLRRYAAGGGSCNQAVVPLMGGLPEELPQRYEQVSPAELGPLPVPSLLLSGRDDAIVPAQMLSDYARLAGGQAQLSLLDGQGHFDTAVPSQGSAAAVYDWLQRWALLPDMRQIEEAD